MFLYNAGLYTSNFSLSGRVFLGLEESEKQKRLANKNFLESYHYISKGQAVNNIRRDGVKIFLDSGAFSAFKLGVEIDLARYCDFIHQNDDIIRRDGTIKMIAPLDVIGAGAKGAELSWKNQEEMERRGTQPLPCFHLNEPWEYLDYYASKYEYIALGGLVRSDLHTLESWFDQVFERTCNADGTPRIKFHAFSLTALKMMLKYPWHSVDSSTWVQWAANGLVLQPRSGRQVNVSSQSSSRKMPMQHLDTLPPIMRQSIVDEFEYDEQNVERLQKTYQARWAWNCWAFPAFVDLREPATHFYNPNKGLF